MADLVRISVEPQRGVTVAAIDGELDIASVGDVKETLMRAVDGGAPGLVLDLTRVRYLDSAAVGVLFELAERLRGSGQTLRLVLPDGALMRKTLLLTGVDRVAAIDSEVGAALNALQ